MQNILKDLRGTTFDRCLFTTQSGLVGLGPKTSEKGDILTVLFGGRWPFILRRKALHYLLVGPCYANGIMDGEAVKDREELDIPPRTFEIR